MEVNQEDSGSNVPGRCKLVMNAIRRAFSFRERREEPATDREIEMQPLVAKPPKIILMAKCPGIGFDPRADMASTSAVQVPSVYEDPFVAVSADGYVHIKHYYSYNSRAEFRLESIHSPAVKMNSRVMAVKSVVKVYYTPGSTVYDDMVVKTWGICSNNVWWASHLNRLDKTNIFTNVVLHDNGALFPGFTVVNIDAFAESLQCVGLPKDSPFQGGLPIPPLHALRIPYIDDDVDEEMIQAMIRYNNTPGRNSPGLVGFMAPPFPPRFEFVVEEE